MKGQLIFGIEAIHIIFLLVIMSAGCSKNEQPVEEPIFSRLFIKAIMADTLRMRVLNEGREITNELTSPGDRLNLPVTYHDPRHRVQVYSFYGNALLLDTVILYKAASPFYVTFYQAQKGEKLQWIGPPVEEPLPPAGSLKVSIIYTIPQMPATVKVVVENVTSTDVSGVYVPTDSFQLDKGKFSRYFIGRNARTYKPRVSMYTTGPERRLVATAAASEFRTTNLDYSTFLFDKSVGSTVLTLTSEKLY